MGLFHKGKLTSAKSFLNENIGHYFSNGRDEHKRMYIDF